jgi:hypothetical protein
MEFAMSWLVFIALAAVPVWLSFDVLGPCTRGAAARWWSGRALLATVVHFCVALLVAATAALTLDRHTLAATDLVDAPGQCGLHACA